MSRQVFICYSNQDEALLNAFRVHLKPWEADRTITIWRDREAIRPSQRWDDEIKKALAGIDAAVLLLSPDFFATDYVRDVELPYLLRAREEGRIELTWLHLRPCHVDRDDRAIEVPVSSGGTKRVKLTDYQGLHDKKIIIADVPETQRDAVYAVAAANLIDLMTETPSQTEATHATGIAPNLIDLRPEAPPSRPKPARAPGNTVYELTVRLKLNGSQLRREFFYHYGRIVENSSPWPMPTGTNVFEMLFGSQDTCDTVLRTLLGIDLAPPVRQPVRVRLQTDEPRLAEVPWMNAAWEDHLLVTHGWTFELIREPTFEATPKYLDVTLNTPCSVLMIAPEGAPEADAHTRDLQERLDHAWPVYHEPPHRVRDWQALQRTWRQRRPRLVYYYGPAAYDQQELVLVLDNDQGGIDRRPVRDLHTLWQDNPPLIAFFNVTGEGASPGTAMAGLPLPLVITQYGFDADHARHSALAWWHALLEGGEDTDPVWALHQHGLFTAAAWGAYGYWQTQTARKPRLDKLPRLLIDRRAQRSLSRDAVDELVRDRDGRVCCVLAYGAQGNLVELFAEQLRENLRRYSNRVAQVKPLRMRLPGSTSFEMDQLELMVRRELRLGSRETFGAGLEKHRPRGPGATRPVLLLDWGVRGTHDGNRLRLSALEVWLTFCARQLAVQYPPDLRLVCCLSLEIAEDNHDTLRRRLDKLETDGLFPTPSFRVLAPTPLDHIAVRDLADFLIVEDHTSCPKELIPVIPTLIWRQTQGRFQETVALVEQAEQTGWFELYDRLVAEGGPLNGDAAEEEDELL